MPRACFVLPIDECRSHLSRPWAVRYEEKPNRPASCYTLTISETRSSVNARPGTRDATLDDTRAQQATTPCGQTRRDSLVPCGDGREGCTYAWERPWISHLAALCEPSLVQDVWPSVNVIEYHPTS